MFEKASMLVLKVTRDCNLRCKYCYLKDKDDYKGEIMSIEMLKKVIDKVIADKKKPEAEEVMSIVLHGGEPLMVGKKNLALYLNYIHRAFKEAGLHCDLSIQTNTTLIDEEILSTLSKFGVTVGVSFDGEGKSNSGRTSKGTHDFVEILHKISEYNIQYGVLSVISEVNIDNVINDMTFLRDKLGRRDVKINYSEDTLSVGCGEVTGEEYFNKVVKILLEKYIEGTLPIAESNLEHLLKDYFLSSLLGVYPYELYYSNCGTKFCGGGVRVIESSPDGTFHLCGRYSKDTEDTLIGSVFEKDFLSLKATNVFFKTITTKIKEIKRLGCDSCIADDICDHGCIAFHHNKFGEWGIREDLVCDLYIGLKKMMVKNEVKIFHRMYENQKNHEGIMYLNFGIDISKEMLDLAKSKLGRYYEISHDEKFKSIQEDFRPQLKFVRK
jgi:radical SAM protein with 4Fe4S-binding SPASM domain